MKLLLKYNDINDRITPESNNTKSGMEFTRNVLRRKHKHEHEDLDNKNKNRYIPITTSDATLTPSLVS